MDDLPERTDTNLGDHPATSTEAITVITMAEARNEISVGTCRRVSYTATWVVSTNAVGLSDTSVEFAGSVIFTNASVPTETTTTVTDETSTSTFRPVFPSDIRERE